MGEHVPRQALIGVTVQGTRWHVTVSVNGQILKVGPFDTAAEAVEAYDKAVLARDGWCGHLLECSSRHAGLPTKQAHQAGPLRRTRAKLNHDREHYRAWHATAWDEDAEVHGMRVRAAAGGPPGAQACAQQGCCSICWSVRASGRDCCVLPPLKECQDCVLLYLAGSKPYRV